MIELDADEKLGIVSSSKLILKKRAAFALIELLVVIAILAGIACPLTG
ncbi:MAG: hypothetical protein M2R45_05422 [Verrucomicrobia subdivision 3 bacterium]|nr:hypothetical protein [Limisphaerales bacterium]MCS1413000.1 hypothetical protein [Limisphaerales bacterium]